MNKLKRWMVPLPLEDWKKHWKDYLSHGGTGVIAAAGMLIAPLYFPFPELVFIAFGMVTPAVYARQYIEFLRRNDTPGRDLKHHLMGYVLGLGIGVAWFAAAHQQYFAS